MKTMVGHSIRIFLSFLAIMIAFQVGFANTANHQYHPVPGPSTITLGDHIGQLNLPANLVFFDKEDTKASFEQGGQPFNDRYVGMILSKEPRWFAVYSYVETGYIRDDEAKDLNADALLESMKKRQVEANKEREKLGSKPLEIIGWDIPPSYDQSTHTLRWSVALKEGDSELINYSSIVLGRYGILACTLVDNYANRMSIRPKIDLLASATSFTSGKDYASWTKGDKVSALSMKSLITGGGAAAAIYTAAKVGLFAKGIKLLIALALILKKGIILVVIAIVGFFKKLFGRGKDPNKVN